MKVYYLCLFLLHSILFASVQSKPRREHESFFKETASYEDKETKSPNLYVNDLILPTILPFEASSPEQEGDETGKEALNGVEATEQIESGALEVADEDQRNTAVLLSDKEISRLLQALELEQQDVEEEEAIEDINKNKMLAETKEMSTVVNHAFAQHKEEEQQQQNKKEVKEDDVGSSTNLEIPMDLDYAADSETIDSLNPKLEENKTLIMNLEKERKLENEIHPVMKNYSFQPNQDDKSSKEESDAQHVPTGNHKDRQKEFDTQNDQNNTEESQENESKKVEFHEEKNTTVEEQTNRSDKNQNKKPTTESDRHAKVKGKNWKRHHQRKMQSDHAIGEISSENAENQDEEADSKMVQRVDKKRNRKWAPLLGMNPVQIKATVDLFPRIGPTSRPKTRVGTNGQDADPCENFHCRRGKTCKLNDEKKPSCVCQEPPDCPPSFNEFDHVCGTDNQTYDSTCQLFATKCSFEGSKKGHRLHLDYTGSCKFIPPCPEIELVQFPLRMRDWLKNVLLQLYEHDFLTPKQRSKVQKIYESERHLHEGDYTIELLALDFEKNHNMYIYPVHWQFAQIDQHPSDGVLSHSELAPLRAPLVPLEHCTSVFFQECDTDKDKLLSFREWCRCFGIKDEDVNTKLLF